MATTNEPTKAVGRGTMLGSNQRRGPVTDKALTVGLENLIKAVERHHITLDGFAPQDLLRPVDNAIREAQQLINIQIAKADLADQERRLTNMEGAIEESKRKIAQLENGLT